MTDEQVTRIVEALEGSGELWSTLGVTAVAAILGALSTLGIQWLSDRKRKGESDAAAKAAAAKAASVLAARFAMTPGPSHLNMLMDMPKLAAGTRTDLLMLEESGEVAKWWTRHLIILAAPPSQASGFFTDEEMTHKARVATAVQRRMLAWATGKVRVEEFHESHDAAFLQALEDQKK